MKQIKCSIYQTVFETHKAGRYDSTRAVCNVCGNSSTCHGSGEGSITRCLVLLKNSCPSGEINYYVADTIEERRKYKHQVSTRVYKNDNRYIDDDTEAEKMDLDNLRREYLEKAPYPFDGTIQEGMFTNEEKEYIAKYGYWFEAIWAGKVPLTTEKLKRFKQAKEIPTPERTRWEDLWVRYDQERCPF